VYDKREDDGLNVLSFADIVVVRESFECESAVTLHTHWEKSIKRCLVRTRTDATRERLLNRTLLRPKAIHTHATSDEHATETKDKIIRGEERALIGVGCMTQMTQKMPAALQSNTAVIMYK